MVVGWITSVAVASSGPYAVGWQDRAFEDPIAGNVPIRVYYPAVEAGEGTAADPSSGPFPLAAFLHGWLGSTWMYDEVCAELASQGFVVGSLDTETGLVLDMDAFADDAVAMLYALEARADVPEDPLAGMVSDADWTAFGHSMGGATLGGLLGLEPRIRTAVAFMPYQGEAEYYDAVRDYDGALLLLSGTNDTTAPPVLQQAWLAAADRTSRSLLVQVTDLGHKAVTDLTWNEDPLPDPVQRAIVLGLATAFVRSEHGGEEDRWVDLIGPIEGTIERATWSRSHDPAVWAAFDGRVTVGVAGLPGSTGEVVLGSDEALSDGVDVATLELPTGVGEVTVDVPAGFDGDLWVAVRTDGDDGEVWTRAIALVTGSGPEEEEEEEEVDAPDDEDGGPSETSDGPAGEDRGCSTVPGVGWLGALAVLLARRRR